MAQLSHILGSILRDVTEARVNSDVFAREASIAYQKDPVLRRFPVPRVDISSVEFDLKFTISDVKSETDGNQESDRELRNIKVNQIINRNFERFSEEIVETTVKSFFDHVRSCVERDSDLNEKERDRVNEQWHSLSLKLNSRAHRERLVDRTFAYFVENQNVLMKSEFVFDFETASNGLFEIYSEILLGYPEIEEMKGVLVREKVGEDVETVMERKLREMRNTILWIGKSGVSYKIEVDVAADRLQGKDKDTVSSLKFSARMCNYVWTQVEEQDGTVKRQLIPE